MSSPPPPRYSPDGRWWWDGTRWVPVQAAPPADVPAEDGRADSPTNEEAQLAGPAQPQAPQPRPQAPQPAYDPRQAQAYDPRARQQAYDPRTEQAYDPRAQGQWGQPAPAAERRRMPLAGWIAIAVAAAIVVGALGGGGWWYFTHRAGEVVTEQQARQITQSAWSTATRAYSSGKPTNLAKGFDGAALAMMRAIVDDKAHRGLDEDAFDGQVRVDRVYRSSHGGQFLVEGTAAGGEEHAQLVMEQVGGPWKVVALDLESYADFSPPKVKVASDGTYGPADESGLAVAPDKLAAAYARYLTTGVKGTPEGPFADSEYTSGKIDEMKDYISSAADDDIKVTYAHKGEPPVRVFPTQGGALVVFGFDSDRSDSAGSGCLSFNQPGGRFPSSDFSKAVLSYRGYAFATVPTSGKVKVEGLQQEAATVRTTPC